MKKKIFFLLKRLSEKLWVKPLIFCLLSVGAALIAQVANDSEYLGSVPSVEKESLEAILTIFASSMLVISIFAVGSMLSAFTAAGSSTTPRSFDLIIADDVSQNALSAYIGSFIYSIVAIVSLKNGYYNDSGLFVLFALTLIIFSVVILTFLRWVQRISKLGRLAHTMEKLEAATTKAIHSRVKEPLLGGVPLTKEITKGIPLFCERVGYINHINMEQLQSFAEKNICRIKLNGLPGTFTSPDRPAAFLHSAESIIMDSKKLKDFSKSFIIGETRLFDDDPRFGFIALSEIASRALSPGINDPGTAIAIISSHVRLFSIWITTEKKAENFKKEKYNLIEVPEMSMNDLFEDAFRPIARDGAGNIEVMTRLLKAFKSIAFAGNAEMKELAILHAHHTLKRSEQAIKFKHDLESLQEIGTTIGN